MARIEIDLDGIKQYVNDDGRLHRDDGPAVIYPDGSKFWRINGRPSLNDDGYSEIHTNGIIYSLDRAYYIHSFGHAPARDNPNGFKEWAENGDRIWPKL